MTEYESLAEELRALAHPLRIAILASIAGGHETPTGVFRALVERGNALSLSLVAYHVEKLAQGHLLVLTGTTQEAGGTRHHYEPSERARGLLSALGVLE